MIYQVMFMFIRDTRLYFNILMGADADDEDAVAFVVFGDKVSV